jgi:hypothetical protein
MLPVCLPFQTMNQFTDFYETRYESYDTAGHSNIVLFNLLVSTNMADMETRRKAPTIDLGS